MKQRHFYLFTLLFTIGLLMSSKTLQAEMRSSITQYGVTWTFNGQYECGQFVTGDWWVVGPVTVNSVSPSPRPGRNGSCVNPISGRQGYDDRGQRDTPEANLYSTADQISYPAILQANTSLVSTVSKPDDDTHFFNYGTMISQAVLTVVDGPQPSGTFRPAYCGTYKKYFNTSQINYAAVPTVEPPSSALNGAEIARYMDRPRIDHLSGSWLIQSGCAEENWYNGDGRDACYGADYSKAMSEAAMMAMIDIPEKTEIINSIIQYGIDNYGVIKAGGNFAANGGHYNARKFPVVFAAFLLNDPDMLQVGEDYTSRFFGEDDQTYYNSAGKALWGRRTSDYCWWYQGCTGDGCGGIKDCADPNQLDDGCPTYRKYQTSKTWPGQMLATLFIRAESVWDHDSYFDYVDRWMNGDVGGGGSSSSAFVNEMWDLYRDNLPPVDDEIINPTGVSVVPTSISIDEGMSRQLTATVEPSSATYRTVNWTSSNTTVATVNSEGLVTAVAPGNAVITATTTIGGFTDECAVTVNSSGTNVALNKPITVSDYDLVSDKPGDNLVDGDVSDDARWSAASFPQWAEIDLGADYALTRIDVFPYQNRAYQYIVEGKPDGGSYSTIVDRSANTESADNLYDNVSTTVRYLKITVSGISGNSSTWVSLAELKAYTNDAPQPVGTEFYCSPTGNMSNDGSSPSTPWADLETVMSQKTFADGATIYLMDGNHGFPVISEYNAADVAIINYPGANPVLDRIKFDGASHWVLKGVKINPANPFPETPILVHPVGPKFNNSMIQITASSDITIDDCYAYSIENSDTWTADDWNYKAWNGVFIDNGSDDVLVTNSQLKNVNFGYYAVGSSTNLIFEGSVIENFCGDGVRPDCNNTIIQNNVVKNCYETNGNHDDILQIYRGSTGASGIIIRGNKFINNTDPSQPFLGEAQGIALFDGWYTDMVIENNLVATDDWHGISIYGAINCKVVNNTVVDVNNVGIGPPWIKVTAHKDGSPSTGNLVRNNLTTVLSNDAGIGTVDNNIVIGFSDYDTYFTDAANRNYTTKAGSPAIDAGSSTDAPSVDIAGVVRPQGSGYDIGAYEYVPGGEIVATDVELAPETATLAIGQTAQLTASIIPSNATNQIVMWSSNNTSVADVDASGVVAGVSEGQAIITVTTDDGGFTATCTVDVAAASPEVTLNPVADAFVRGGSDYENINYGSDQTLVIKTGSDAYTRQAFIKFDLSSVSQSVLSAILRLYVSDGGASTHSLKLVSDDSWTETGITYANKPSSGTTIATLDPSTPDGYIEVDISSVVESEAGGFLSLHIVSNNSDYSHYNSKEGANKPELVVTTTSGPEAVTGVSLVPVSLNLETSECSALSETIIPSDATDQSVIWSSSDVNVATVDANGLICAASAGNALITVTTNDGGFTDTCSVTVTQPVTGVSVAPASVSLNIGATTDLTETISPADASDKSVAWSSSDEAIATVDANGLVTAISGGNAVITVTTNDGDFTATCQVVVYQSVTGVSVDPALLTLDIGESAQLTETISPSDASDKTVIWSSGNEAIAAVDANGVVTAMSHGTVIITVTTNDGEFTASSEITVNIGNLALNKPITVSDFQDDEFDFKPGENLVDGDVSDEERWSVGGFPQWAEIDLGDNYDLDRIDLYPYLDRAYQYIVEAKTDGGSYSTIVNRSSNTEGADILSDNVSFNAARYVKITVSGISGSSSTWVSLAELKVYGSVTGTVFVTDVSVSPQAVTLDIDETTTLTPTISPVNATDQTVTWSTSDASIATVDVNGIVTAQSSGQATITATTNDGGFTDNCDVTVNAPQPATLTLNPVADAFVRGGDYADSNYGTDNIISVKKAYGASYIREGYLKFDLSTITGQISSAVLRLYVSSYNGDATHTFKLVSDDSWTETGITYNNKPSAGTTMASYDIEGSGSYIEIDVLSTVAAEAGGLLSIEITGNEDVGNAYDSREATNKPELVVTASGGSSTILVSGVSVSPSSLSMIEGETNDLTETVTPADATDQTVSWSSSNSSVATVNSNGLVTAVSAGNATIIVSTNDGGYTANCSVSVSAPQTRTESVIASDDDQEIRSGGGSQWVGYDIHRVGGGGSSYDAASVHPFQLPALSGSETIISASFSVNLYRIANNPNGNVDAYGLPYRSSSTVLPSADFWQGSYGADANATEIQDDFATTSTALGDVTTSSAGNINLADYINAQFAAGAQAGDYIFIRLNPDVADVSSYKYWEFYSADSPFKPVLDLEIGAAPAKSISKSGVAMNEENVSINVYPNPVEDGDFYVELSGFDKDVAVSIFDITGKQVFNTKFTNNNTPQRINISDYNVMKNGIYFLRISDGVQVKIGKLIFQ